MGSQDCLAHLVHRILHRGALFEREQPEGDFSRFRPCLIELVGIFLHGVQPGEGGPFPPRVDRGRKDAVVHIGEGGEVVADKVVELGTGGFEDEEVGDAGSDLDALVLDHIGLHDSLLVAVAEEGVWVRFAVDGHAGPTVLDDGDVGGVDVFVGFDEVCTQDGGEEFRGVDGILFGHDVGSILHGVGCDNDAVVCFGISESRLGRRTVLGGQRCLRGLNLSF